MNRVQTERFVIFLSLGYYEMNNNEFSPKKFIGKVLKQMIREDTSHGVERFAGKILKQMVGGKTNQVVGYKPSRMPANETIKKFDL